MSETAAPVPASVSPSQGSGYLQRVIASLLTALVVAFVAFAVNVLMLFGANGASWAALVSLSDYFALGTVIVFVLLFIAILLGALSRWYVTLIAGVLAGAIGALLGSVLKVDGGSITSALIGPLFATLGGINLITWLAVTVVFVFLAPPLYAAILRRAGRGVASGRRVAFVRLPASNLADGLTTHIDRVAIDAELADAQWDAYVAAFVAAGWTPVEVAPADDLADSVFVEDTAVVLGDTAIITSPGAESRRDETSGTEAKLSEYALRITRIEQPGTLEGGDVLQVGKTVYVGRGGRTNAEGIRQLRAIAGPLGYIVIAVPVTKALHLKSAVTALPDGTVIGHPSLVDDPGLFERFLPVPEVAGAQVNVLGHDTVMISASAPESAALIEDLGYRVIRVDISEFEKLEGCVTCLSIRLD
ncbi:dimethylargininase [Leifsonia sp. Root112D2]|uniref:dimethylargininase n=1 Tax=Leifsonia sp. Root112D2 TaxID=1736426 RepID=UPI000B208BCF|nr:dimethylargininase [Leifsonia sp. Root112D2]